MLLPFRVEMSNNYCNNRMRSNKKKSMDQCKKELKKLNKEIKSNNFMERIRENLKKRKFDSTPQKELQFGYTNQIFVDCIYILYLLVEANSCSF